MDVKIEDEKFDMYIELFEQSDIDIVQKPEQIRNIAEKIYRHLLKLKSSSK